MLRLDNLQEETYVKAGIYGRPGTGKTSLCVTAPRPLIALAERQGFVHIKQAAARLKVPVPPVFYVEDLVDLRNLVRACRGDKKKPFRVTHKFKSGDVEKEEEIFRLDEWPQTLCVDGMTEILRMLTKSLDREAPPRTGADGLPTHTQNYWGVLGDRGGNIIRDLRDLPLNLLMTALADDKEVGEGEQKTRWLGPSMPMRRLADEFSAAVNVVGFTFRRIRRVKTDGKPENQIRYGVMTVGPEYAITKPYRPLRDVEVPDFGYWVKVINGSTQLQEAPPTIGELDTGINDEPTADHSQPEPTIQKIDEPEKKPAAKAKKASK